VVAILQKKKGKKGKGGRKKSTTTSSAQRKTGGGQHGRSTLRRERKKRRNLRENEGKRLSLLRIGGKKRIEKKGVRAAYSEKRGGKTIHPVNARVREGRKRPKPVEEDRKKKHNLHTELGGGGRRRKKRGEFSSRQGNKREGRVSRCCGLQEKI